VIRFTWSEGASNGGTDVLNYNVYYDQGASTATFVLLESSVLTTHYTTTATLTAGETYTFKVTALNTVGESLQSDPLAILAAKLPDAPLNLQNVPLVTTAYQVGLQWQAGAYDGASPVIDY